MSSINQLFSEIFSIFFPIFGQIFFYVAPALFIYAAYKIWCAYRSAVYIDEIPWKLLEIKIPREITKSPKAMEIVLSALHQTSDRNWYIRLVEGFVRPWFSLEIVSISGTVHFYIRTPEGYRNLIESNIYSQYPDVEIVEVEDYTKNVTFGLPESTHEIWGAQFQFAKEDAYPIKTYIDYGLDSESKEELKIDPITPILEFLGSIKPGEQIWIQILIQAKKRFTKKGTPFYSFEKVDWKTKGEELRDEIVKKTGGEGKASALTEGQKNMVDAIERNISKLGFDTGIRCLHIGPADNFDNTNNAALMGVFKQFNSENLNGFKGDFVTSFDYPWQDVRGKRIFGKKSVIFNAYRRRSYFYPPYKFKPMVLNTEELATIFHFPGQVAETPTLTRIESRRGEPPANLPFEK